MDAERQLAQSEEERSVLQDKLAQVERDSLMTLRNKELVHRDQLEAECRQMVR